MVGGYAIGAVVALVITQVLKKKAMVKVVKKPKLADIEGQTFRKGD